MKKFENLSNGLFDSSNVLDKARLGKIVGGAEKTTAYIQVGSDGCSIHCPDSTIDDNYIIDVNSWGDEKYQMLYTDDAGSSDRADSAVLAEARMI